MENYPPTWRSHIAKNMRAALERLPYLPAIHAAVAMPQLAEWRRAKTSNSQLASSRRALHEAMARKVANDRILYLEFGVYKGDSIKYWLQLNLNPESTFVGFDTFTGLPEAWRRNFSQLNRNAFDVGGLVPVLIDDIRCSFQVGLFQNKLRPFLQCLDRTLYDRLIVHMDADLYSATLFVLCETNYILKSGDLIIFDEFNSVLNEYRALQDWSAAYMRQYEVLCVTRWADQISIQLT